MFSNTLEYDYATFRLAYLTAHIDLDTPSLMLYSMPMTNSAQHWPLFPARTTPQPRPAQYLDAMH